MELWLLRNSLGGNIIISEPNIYLMCHKETLVNILRNLKIVYSSLNWKSWLSWYALYFLSVFLFHKPNVFVISESCLFFSNIRWMLQQNLIVQFVHAFSTRSTQCLLSTFPNFQHSSRPGPVFFFLY